jgi:hypothetical protein
MQVPDSTLTRMRASAAGPRLRWGQLSLRSLLALVTLAGTVAFFHEPIAAWTKETWQRWFPAESAPVPPPIFLADPCPECGRG